MSVIDELERLEKEATGGKWSSCDCFVGPGCWCKTVKTDTQPEDWDNNYVVTDGAVTRKDADFIAASRNVFPALLRLARAARHIAQTLDEMTGDIPCMEADRMYCDLKSSLIELGVEVGGS